MFLLLARESKERQKTIQKITNKMHITIYSWKNFKSDFTDILTLIIKIKAEIRSNKLKRKYLYRKM